MTTYRPAGACTVTKINATDAGAGHLLHSFGARVSRQGDRRRHHETNTAGGATGARSPPEYRAFCCNQRITSDGPQGGQMSEKASPRRQEVQEAR